MIDIYYEWLSSDLARAIAYTVLHSLWQGAVLVLLMNLYLKSISYRSPMLRYNVAFATLLLIALSSAFTFIYFYLNYRYSSLSPLAFETYTGKIPIVNNPITNILIPSSSGYFFKGFLPFVSVLWFAGVVFFSLRLTLNLLHLGHLRRSFSPQVPEAIKRAFESIKQEYAIQREIGLAVSDKILSPMITGFIKPIIVLPIATVNHLTPNEIELILRHELGHVIRNDFLHNLILRLIEVTMFYHPCVWWVSNIIQKEREDHCDDYALASGDNRITYVKTLYKIKSMQSFEYQQIALTFSGNKKSLLQRIKRILNQQQKMSIMKGNLIVLAVLISSVICISAGTYYYKNNVKESPERIESNYISKLAVDLPKLTMKYSPIDTTKEEEELRSKERELRSKEREMRESLRELREELREIRKERVHEIEDMDWDDEEWQKEFEEKMEEFGERMEDLGDEISIKFDGEFSDEIEAIAANGAKIGIQIAESFADVFDEEFEMEIEELAEEIERSAHEWEMNHDDKSFAYNVEEMGENIGAMVGMVVEGVFDGLKDINHSFVMINPEKDEFVSSLLNTMKSDDLYSNNKVSLRVTEDEMKVNGKIQSKKHLKKYKKLINKFNDVDFEGGQKFIFKYSDKKGKKSSIKVEISE